MKKNIFLTLVLFISYYCLGQNGTYQVTNIANPSFSDLAIKISSIAGANATIHVNKTLTLNANLIVPENISLKFYKGPF